MFLADFTAYNLRHTFSTGATLPLRGQNRLKGVGLIDLRKFHGLSKDHSVQTDIQNIDGIKISWGREHDWGESKILHNGRL